MTDDQIDPLHPPLKLPCVQRLDKLEADFVVMQGHQVTMLTEIRESRECLDNNAVKATELIEKHALEARELIMHEAEMQRVAVREEGIRVAEQFAAQGATILAISSALNTVQANISKWAAGGALVGSVLLFIAVRGLGL